MHLVHHNYIHRNIDYGVLRVRSDEAISWPNTTIFDLIHLKQICFYIESDNGSDNNDWKISEPSHEHRSAEALNILIYIIVILSTEPTVQWCLICVKILDGNRDFSGTHSFSHAQPAECRLLLEFLIHHLTLFMDKLFT